MSYSTSTEAERSPTTAEAKTESEVTTDGAAGLTALSQQQRTVIEWMTAGETAATAASVAGVNRRTIYRWLKADANFKAALNSWQADVLATAQARLVAATDVAVTAVIAGMARGESRTALAVLTKLGLLKPPEVGPVEPDQVAAAQRAAREREMARDVH